MKRPPPRSTRTDTLLPYPTRFRSKEARILVNMGTVGTRFVEDMARELAASSIVTIDCPISGGPPGAAAGTLSIMASRSEEHTSELQSLMRISYAVFCLKKKKTTEVTATFWNMYYNNHKSSIQ